MSISVVMQCPQGEARYHGLRVSADQYFQLEDDGCRYELIDGVICMSPSPTPIHQYVVAEIVGQLYAFLKAHRIGRVAVEVDVHLGRSPHGGDLVYRPDIVYLRNERVASNLQCIREAPDLVVEVVSPTSRQFDRETKRMDYERFGVLEYWIIDPEKETMTFYRLVESRLVVMPTPGDAFHSEAVGGLALDLAAIREFFQIG